MKQCPDCKRYMLKAWKHCDNRECNRKKSYRDKKRHCITCNKLLTGLQKKHCSIKHANEFNRLKNYGTKTH